jgi:hypothetical protein
MWQYYTLCCIAAILLLASMTAGIIKLAWIGDWLILLACGLFIPAMAAIYYLVIGNVTVAQEIATAIITVTVAVTAGSFFIATAIYPSVGKIALSVATILTTMIAWSLK